MSRIHEFLVNEDGTTVIEYALIGTILGTFLVAVLSNMEQVMTSLYSVVQTVDSVF